MPEKVRWCMLTYIRTYINLRNEWEIWKIFFELGAIDRPLHVPYCTLEVKWLSARLFHTMHRLPEQTFFAYNWRIKKAN